MYEHGAEGVVEIYKRASGAGPLEDVRKRLEERGWEEEDFRAARGAGIAGLVPLPFAPAVGAGLRAKKGKKTYAALGAVAGGTLGGYGGTVITAPLGGIGGLPGRMAGAYYGAGEGSRLARDKAKNSSKKNKKAEKTASIYAAAHRNLALAKIASAYEIEEFPPGYDEALLKAAGYEPMDKEAVLGTVGKGLARGVASAGKLFGKDSKAGRSVRNVAAGTARLMKNNAKTTGGLALGAAGVGAAGVGGAGALGAARLRNRRE